MVNFIMIAFCIITGSIFRRLELVPHNAHKGINTWIIYIALPAVSFKYIPKITWTSEMLFPILAMVVVWLGSWLFVALFCRWKGYRQRSRSTLELASGYSNTSFIGFPLISAYFGEAQLGIAIICDQTTFVLLSTAGLISALKGNRSNASGIKPATVVKKLLTFPPLIGCLLSLSISPFFDLTFAEPFFDKLVATLGPLALFTIGLQLRFDGWRKQLSQISMSLLYKLIIAPLLVLIIAIAMGIKGDIGRISVFEAAMPTLLTTSIIAEQYRLNTKLINLIIGISILLSMFTTALWETIIRMFL